jgi:hypothetical protein
VAEKSRPKFRPVQQPSVHKTPEELFYKLSRAKTHGYLRGPQQDVLREYAEKHADKSADIAFELPTGTGKTGVGLLVAEWVRTSSKRVAYLSLTNQLTGQVLAEGKKLGIPCADLRGTKGKRDPEEEGRFLTRAAVGVTTYSNLFNFKPLIKECDLLVFDDAHGGEQYVVNKWTVTVRHSSDKSLYNALLGALRPGITDAQLRSILDRSGFPAVEIVDVCGHEECLTGIEAALEGVENDEIKFPWLTIKQHLKACLYLVSRYEITIRPLVPPTHTHHPFADAKQRIYMSATLGGESDLRRAYGITTLEMVRAKSPQWGRRYVFVPGVYVSEADATTITAGAWDGMSPRRGVLLAPSERIKDVSFEALKKAMTVKPKQFEAEHISDSIDEFTETDDAILTLAGRYDGLDLPDEQCRLLLMWGSPAATNPLERHLSERWKLGPVLRRRERTRLIQGMGRCTRSATDFAIIVWLGQSLVNAATSSALLAGMPAELAAEIDWGVKQSELAAKNHGDALIEMIAGLLDESDYRDGANSDIDAVPPRPHQDDPAQYEQFGISEVKFARAMWDENFAQAAEIGRGIADHITAPELSGYRAWWWYLTSTAAGLFGESDMELDALRRGSKCGVNGGWLNRVLRDRGETPTPTSDLGVEPNAERLWDLLTNWGWAGPGFHQKVTEMLTHLGTQYHVDFHQGLEALGKSVGALTTRVTEQGAPDVVWSFPSDLHFVFEAKTEKKDGGQFSKKDLQEAKGHPDWVRANLCEGRPEATIEPVIIGADAAVHSAGLPFTGGLYHLSPDEILKWAQGVVEAVTELRLKFSGKEFAASATAFSTTVRNKKIDLESIAAFITSTPLKK